MAGTCLLPTASYLDSFGPYDPQSVLCDYEQALHNAIVATWPGVTPRGCHFHYTQALWRNLQRTDLVPEYQVEGSEVRKSFKMMAAKKLNKLIGSTGNVDIRCMSMYSPLNFGSHVDL